MAKDTQQVAAIQVAIRIRPFTERDRAQPRNAEVLRAHDKQVQIIPQSKYFTYDHVFSNSCQQSDIFTTLGQRPVQKFVEGYNVTMLAYGQTSSGKTYTMGTALHTGGTTPDEEGIVPRAMALLFDLLSQQTESPRSTGRLRMHPSSKYKYSVKVSFVEIYNEELIDLLNSAPPNEKPIVNIREDTKGHIYWTGVKEMTVNNTEDVLCFLQQGTQNRATGSTDMNEKSSRSHAIFSVTLKQEKWVPSAPHSNSSRAASPIPSKAQSKQPKQNTRTEDGEWIITNSKFHFVDLAGSERLKRTAAEGDRRKEGININAGLLALGNVISALGDPSKKSTHIPYRDSKLTRLLQDSLGGSAMTLMIACVSPAETNLSETLNTLQYANRARNIKNKIEKNEMEEWMSTDNVEILRTTIAKLKAELRKSKQEVKSEFSDDLSSGSSPNPDFDDLYHGQHMQIADLQHKVEALKTEAEFTKERNRIVEDELMRLREQGDSEMDFQHLVEPVIEEYEKSISGLESQLAMIRAALSHSNHGYEEQQAKIEQCEIVIDSQEQTINELRKRVGKLLERQVKDETYITELEKKLMTTVEETVHDRELLSELRGKILKLKEVDESTEQYIRDLESRLTISDAERSELKEKLSTSDEKEPVSAEPTDELHKKLEKQLMDSKNENQDTLKELDEVLYRYQEALEHIDSLQQKPSESQEIELLRDSIKHLEHELDLSSKREMILRQMSEEQSETFEVENALRSLEMSQEEISNGDILRSSDEEEIIANTTDLSTMTQLNDQSETELMKYKREVKNLTNLLKHIKKLRATESKLVSDTDIEHKMIMKSLVILDKQISEQYERIKIEAKRFSNDVHELVNMNTNIENSLGLRKQSMIRPPTNFSKPNEAEESAVSKSDLIFQHEKNRYAYLTRLSTTRADIKSHKVFMHVLENKLKNTESILSNYHQRMDKSQGPVTDVDMEYIMHKMDAMRIQLESNDNKRTTMVDSTTA